MRLMAKSAICCNFKNKHFLILLLKINSSIVFYCFSKPVEWSKSSNFSANMTNLLNIEYIDDNESRKNVDSRLENQSLVFFVR